MRQRWQTLAWLAWRETSCSVEKCWRHSKFLIFLDQTWLFDDWLFCMSTKTTCYGYILVFFLKPRAIPPRLRPLHTFTCSSSFKLLPCWGLSRWMCTCFPRRRPEQNRLEQILNKVIFCDSRAHLYEKNEKNEKNEKREASKDFERFVNDQDLGFGFAEQRACLIQISSHGYRTSRSSWRDLQLEPQWISFSRTE